LNPEDGTDRLSRKSVANYHSTVRNIPVVGTQHYSRFVLVSRSSTVMLSGSTAKKAKITPGFRRHYLSQMDTTKQERVFPVLPKLI